MYCVSHEFVDERSSCHDISLYCIFTSTDRARQHLCRIMPRESFCVGRDPATKEEIDCIVTRLHTAHTKSSEGGVCKIRPETRDTHLTIGRKGASQDEIDDITDRLTTTHTKSSLGGEPCKAPPDSYKVHLKIGREPVSEEEAEVIVTRLKTAHTKASSGEACRIPPNPRASFSIARDPASEEEIDNIVTRLKTTQTKSGSGESCKVPSEPNVPGYGLKMFPTIPGIETRFKGATVHKDRELEIAQRLTRAHTASSRARTGTPKILLFPERTLLQGDPARIKAFQTTGETVKQHGLGKREKWYM